jgi:hypothetical protein
VYLQVSPLGGSRDETWRGQGIRSILCLGICQNWVSCDGAMEVLDHIPHRTTYGQNSSWVVHEIPVECLSVCCGSVWYVVQSLCTITIDSVLANSKIQNSFLFPVRAMFRHDCPLAVKHTSTPRRLVQKKNLEGFSTHWHASLRHDYPGYRAAKVGNPGGN